MPFIRALLISTITIFFNRHFLDAFFGPTPGGACHFFSKIFFRLYGRYHVGKVWDTTEPFSTFETNSLEPLSKSEAEKIVSNSQKCLYEKNPGSKKWPPSRWIWYKKSGGVDSLGCGRLGLAPYPWLRLRFQAAAADVLKPVGGLGADKICNMARPAA